MQASETLLQRMTALYVASHYRNTPNDLQLAADAPAHALFVLLGPVEESANVMPDILAAVQVCDGTGALGVIVVLAKRISAVLGILG